MSYRVITEEQIYYDPDLPHHQITPKEFEALELRCNNERISKELALNLKGVKEVTKDSISYQYLTNGHSITKTAMDCKADKNVVINVLKERGLYEERN